MVGICVVFLVALIMCRFIAGYDSRFQNGKYIVIKSPILRKLLMDKESLFERKKRLPKDINKMSVSGLISYIVAAVALVFALFSCLNLPQILIEPTDIFFEYVDTLNQKVAFLWVLIFVALVFSFLVIELIRCSKTTEPKWVKVLIDIIAALALIVCAAVLFVMIKELVMCYKYFV